MSQVMDLYEDSDDMLMVTSPPRQLSRKRPPPESTGPDAVSNAAGKESCITDLGEATQFPPREKKRQRSNKEVSSDAVSREKRAGQRGSSNRNVLSAASVSPATASGTKSREASVAAASHASPIFLDKSDDTPRKIPAVTPAHTPNQWAIMFKKLCEYRKKNGDCLVPETCPENPDLGEWVETQREQYRFAQAKHDSSMTAVRIKSLESIEFVWDVSDTVWQSRFRELVDFENHHKHCNVPQEEPNLAEWVKEQREQYKLRQEDKASTMTLEHVDDLECLDFPWIVESEPSSSRLEWAAAEATADKASEFTSDAHVSDVRTDATAGTKKDDRWATRFRELCDYRDKMGNCLVPNKYPDNPALGTWVSTQRQQLRPSTGEGDESSAESRVTIERVKALEGIGFVWNVRPKTVSWATRFNQLVEFQKLHSHCNVPRDDSKYSKNPQLGRWVSHQRGNYRLYKEGKSSSMTPERILQLEDIGFQWHLHRTNANKAPTRSTDPQPLERSLEKLTTASESAPFRRRTAGPRVNSQKNHLSFSHHLLLGDAIGDNERASADDKPANAAPGEDDATAQQMPQDKMFQSDKILDPVELELVWLGEESILCLPCSEFQFDFIYEYASSALRVGLRKLPQHAESEAERLKQLVRMNDWMVARRVDIVRKEVRRLLARGYRRRFMGTVIAELRLLRRGQSSERHFPPIDVGANNDDDDAGDMLDAQVQVPRRDSAVVQQVNTETLEVIATFPSQSEAERRTGVGRKDISRGLRQGRPYGGYLWKTAAGGLS